MPAHIGQRLIFDGALCTIRYIGPVEGTSGEWLGVEWDDHSRGKHNGSHKGKQIFNCLSPSDTAASFVRPARKPDDTRTVLEAIRYKYEQTTQTNGSLRGPGYEIIEISKKKVEEVGFDKIKQQMSRLENLRIVLIDQLNVAGLTTARELADIRAAQAELSTTCPNITELDLGWNPLEDWNDVLDICRPLAKLRVLKASGLRLRDTHARQQIAQVTELHLSDCLLKTSEVVSLLSDEDVPAFPSLATLWLSQNALHAWDNVDSNCVFPRITTLVLENNNFHTLTSLTAVFKLFPNIASLSLQGNKISSAGEASISSPLSTTLTHLNLASNAIATFDTIDHLPQLFPALQSLRISKNPLYDALNQSATAAATSRPSDTPFYLTLARLPKLTALNYTNITPRDREEGEIYYLFVTEKDIRSELSSAPASSATQLLRSLQAQHSTYTALCTKYERPNILLASSASAVLEASKTPDFAAGTSKSLAARLVKASFYIAGTDGVFERLLPRTTSVYTLKSLLARHFGLVPLQFRLVYESKELDPVQVTTTKLYGGTREEWEAWGQWDVDVRRPGAMEQDGQEHGVNGEYAQNDEVWIDGELLRGGTRWRKRETEVLDGMREWGDYLDESCEVRIRIESLEC